MTCLHVRVLDALNLHSTSGSAVTPPQAFCVARIGGAWERTENATAGGRRSFDWGTVLVFDAAAVANAGPQVSLGFEVWQTGVLRDELLAKGSLELPPKLARSMSGCGCSDGASASDGGSGGGGSGQPPPALTPPGDAPTPDRCMSVAVALQAQAASHGWLGMLGVGGGGSGSFSTAGALMWTPHGMRRGPTRRPPPPPGELRVQLWWGPAPAARLPPPALVHRLSFLAEDCGVRGALPSATLITSCDAVLLEEPCIAFVKLSVSTVCLGSAAAGAASSADALRQLHARLLQDGRSAGAGAVPDGQQRRGACSGALLPLGSVSSAAAAPSAAAAAFGGGGLGAVGGRSAYAVGAYSDGAEEAGGLDGWQWLDEDVSGASGDEGVDDWDTASVMSAAAALQQQPLVLTVKVQLGKADALQWKPVHVGPSGLAPVRQSTAFAVTRPLTDAQVHFQLVVALPRNSSAKGGGGSAPTASPAGAPATLTVSFHYSLFQLLRRSPPQPLTFESWRLLRFNTMPGIQVPIPGLPGAYVDVMAMVADVDMRAGMYGVPPVVHPRGSNPRQRQQQQQQPAGAAQASPPTGPAGSGGGGDDGAARDAGDNDADLAASEDGDRLGAGRAAGGGLRRRLAMHLRRPIKAARHDLMERTSAIMHEAVDNVVLPHLSRAVNLLPEPVAQRVRRRVLPSLRQPRAGQVVSLGQLRLASLAPAAAAAAAAAAAIFDTPPSYPAPRSAGPSFCSSAPSSRATAAAVESQRAQRVADAQRVLSPLPAHEHSNLAVAGSEATQPLAVLELTVVSIQLSKEEDVSGCAMLFRCGPNWAHVPPGALPIVVGGSGEGAGSRPGSAGSADPGAASGGPKPGQVQLLLPCYHPSPRLMLLLHRRGVVVARLSSTLTGVLPLLLRTHNKTLPLYSNTRNSAGQRLQVGRVTVRASATLPAAAEPLLPLLPRHVATRLWPAALLLLSYLLSPEPLAMHTSALLSTTSGSERADAVQRIVRSWMKEVAPFVPNNIVRKVLRSDRRSASLSRLKAQLRRVQEVLAWLPRRLDPVGIYHWRRPWLNLLLLLLLGHLCLQPAKSLLLLTLLGAVAAVRCFVMRLHTSSLGFKMDLEEEEDGEEAAAAEEAEEEEGGDAPVGSNFAARLPVLLRSPPVAGGRAHFQESVQRLRRQLHAGSGGSSTGGGASGRAGGSCGSGGGLDQQLAALQQQLEAGALDLSAITIDLEQLLSVRGAMRMMRYHSPYFQEYLLLLQGCIDVAAAWLERLHVLLMGYDPIASAIFYIAALTSLVCCCVFGLGAGTYISLLWLLRPPFMRGVPGIFGWRPFLCNVPCRTVDDAS